jgi:uncharacterized membrane protein
MAARLPLLAPDGRVGARLRRAALPALALFGATAMGAGHARAEFAVCNQTLDVVNVAIGQESDADTGGGPPVFQTEGWWTVGANQCANVIQEPLTKRFIYVYATDIFGQPLLSGSAEMCVERRGFKILGIEACWERGRIAARFYAVDTLEQERWTFFLAGSGP